MTFMALALTLMCVCLPTACKKAEPTAEHVSPTLAVTAADKGTETAALAYARNCANAMEGAFIDHGSVDYAFLPQPADCSNTALGSMAPQHSPAVRVSELLVAPDRQSYDLRVTATTGQQITYSSIDKVLNR